MRKPIALFAMLIFIALYAMGAATIGTRLNTAPHLVQLGYYIVAGIAWVFPLKPLIDWMNRA